jgi:hypothetical protein
MAPGSGFLTTLDSSSPPGVKEVALWGNTQWPYFAYYTSDDAGKSWWADYHAAEQASHDYDQSANNIESNISGWDYLVPGYAEAEWAAVWSNRSRAGDWSATCAGMVDEEGAWEKATCDAFIGGGSLAGGDGQSDGLVAISSQKAIPSPATILRDNGSCGCNTNHGDAIAKDDAGHTIRQNVYIALTTAGALHN